VKYLIDKGAPVTHDALGQAVKYNHLDIIELLIEHGAQITPYDLRTATQYNYKLLNYLRNIKN
jgi:ankyrin repeat protein